MSNSLRPHGLQPSRLLCPWDFPGKSTGVGCHCLLRWRFYLSTKIWEERFPYSVSHKSSSLRNRPSHICLSNSWQVCWDHSVGKRTVFSISGTWKTGYPHAKEWNPYLIPYSKTNCKYIKGLNLRGKTVKLLENWRKSLCPWIWQWFRACDNKSTTNKQNTWIRHH